MRTRSLGIVIRGTEPVDLSTTRLAPLVDELARRDIAAEAVLYDESTSNEFRDALLQKDAALVWVDPVVKDRDRSDLDAILREAADRGVFVSAHPETILRMGTKEVLFETRDLGWGSDVRLYRDRDELVTGIKDSLATGPRVLKQYRGNGGIGVWKVESLDGGMVRIQGAHARTDDTEDVSLDEFIDRSARYFDYSAGDGRLIDQPFQPLIKDGMVRCYSVKAEVVGFARQFAAEGAKRVLGLPAAKTMFPPTEPQFQKLRSSMERDWIPGLLNRVGLSHPDLPVLWDADFLFGPNDTYVLCEINVSAVSPFPDEAVPKLASAVASALDLTPTA